MSMKGAFRSSLFFIILAVTLAAFSSAASLGVSPPYYEFTYEPNMPVSVSFNFYSDDPELDYSIILDGDLKEHFSLSTESFKGSGSVTITGSFPSEMPTPGRHDIGVFAKQVQPRGNGGFGGVPSVGGLIVIRVPYPGKYLEGTFEINDINEGGKAQYELALYSRGNEEVLARTRIEIVDGSGKMVKSIVLGEDAIASGSSLEISDALDLADVSAGTYTARVVSDYSGESFTREDEFRIGELKIVVTDHAKNFTGGTIAPFFVEVESSWNEPLNGVYAELQLEGFPVAKTSPSDIAALGKTRLEGFVDLSSVEEERVVNGKIIVHYGDYASEENVSLVVTKPEFKLNYLYLVLGAVIILLIALFVAVIIMYKKISRKNGGKKK
jgi:hypothetical protein